MKDIIAIIFDFDDTLAPDSTSGFLAYKGVDVRRFWQETVDPLLEQGWDPVPAYLYRLIELSRTRQSGKKITQTAFQEWGRRMTFYPGATKIFSTLRKHVEKISQQKQLKIEIEFYIISTGIGDIVNSARISRQFKQIWANNFHYSESGEIAFPRNVLSFTDKTRYLFHVSKGIIGKEYFGKPFEVNRKLPADQYRIPFKQMIFVGDGYTDVPCFSLIQNNGGIAIGVYDRNNRDKWGKAWGFVEDRRVSNLAAADYRKGSGLYDSLIMAVESICDSIALNKRIYRG